MFKDIDSWLIDFSSNQHHMNQGQKTSKI